MIIYLSLIIEKCRMYKFRYFTRQKYKIKMIGKRFFSFFCILFIIVGVSSSWVKNFKNDQDLKKGLA